MSLCCIAISHKSKFCGSSDFRCKTTNSVAWLEVLLLRKCGLLNSTALSEFLFGNSSFCACRVQIWPKTLVNAHQLLKRPLRNCGVCSKCIIALVIKAQNDCCYVEQPSSCNAVQLSPVLVLIYCHFFVIHLV